MSCAEMYAISLQWPLTRVIAFPRFTECVCVYLWGERCNQCFLIPIQRNVSVLTLKVQLLIRQPETGSIAQNTVRQVVAF